MAIKRYILPILFALVIAFGGICFNPTSTHAMSSVIFAGYPDPLNKTDATTEYNSVGGGYTWGGQGKQVVSTAGKIKNLYVELDAAPGTDDDTYTFTLMYDGSASALTCAIVGTATSASDTTHEIDVVAGKLIQLRVVSSGSPANTPNAQWTMMFSGTTANESLILGRGIAHTSSLVSGISTGTGIGAGTTEVNLRQICPAAGTIKNLYVDEVDGIGTGTWTLTVNKNSTPQALTCAVTVAAPTNSDTGAGFAVVAGDTLTMTTAVSGSITTAGALRWGMTFVATTDGESIILGGSGGAQTLNTSTTPYFNALSTSVSARPWNATETNEQHLGQVCVLKNLYMLIDGAAGAEKSYDFTVMDDNTHASGITCQIAGASAVSNNDTAHTATLAAGNNISLRAVATGTPTARRAYWGLVCYMYPAIANAPDTWTINGITGNSRIEPNTTYYSNPLGDTKAPSATVADGECRFTITNSSTTPIDLTVNFPNMAGGDASANSDNGSNTTINFGAYSYFSGKTLASKVIAKKSGSAVAYSNLPSLTNILWGLQYISQTNAWTSGTAMSCNVTVSATAH